MDVGWTSILSRVGQGSQAMRALGRAGQTLVLCWAESIRMFLSHISCGADSLDWGWGADSSPLRGRWQPEGGASTRALLNRWISPPARFLLATDGKGKF